MSRNRHLIKKLLTQFSTKTLTYFSTCWYNHHYEIKSIVFKTLCFVSIVSFLQGPAAFREESEELSPFTPQSQAPNIQSDQNLEFYIYIYIYTLKRKCMSSLCSCNAPPPKVKHIICTFSSVVLIYLNH